MMKHIKLFNDFLNEGKFNTVSKVIKEIGTRPSKEEVAEFIYNNFSEVTGEKSKDMDIEQSDKVADLISFFKFDIEEWIAAWEAKVSKEK